jgi:hypothetical protein
MISIAIKVFLIATNQKKNNIILLPEATEREM